MNRTNALDVGMAVVEALGGGLGGGLARRHRGTAPDRTAAAMMVAEFLVGEPQEEVAELPPAAPDDYTSAGPARLVECEVSPGDRLFVRAARPPAGSSGRPLVGIEATANGETAQIVLSPSRARAWAAGVLDAADEADGTTPLNFLSGGAE